MKKILVCTDGSNYSRVACQYAAWIAQRENFRVEALYVSSLWEFELPFLVDLGGSLGASPYQGMTGQLEQFEERKADLVRQAVLRVLEENGVTVDADTFHHETGLLVDCLTPYETGDNPPSLIILGKRGESAEQAIGHLGGNLERVVRATRRPCLVTNREFRTIRKVALAYDGGESGQRALDWVITDTCFRDLDFSVVTVDDGHGESEHARALQIAEQRLADAEISAECRLLTGDVEDEIERFVREQNIDLLIMGAYGHSRVRELLIGSTTTDLIRRCRIPVLLFH